MKNALVPERGRALLTLWRTTAEDIAHALAGDGPESAHSMGGAEHVGALGDHRAADGDPGRMASRSSISWGWRGARPIASATSSCSASIHSALVASGEWTAVPDTMPALALTAPSGTVWTFGDPAAGVISGDAVEFAAVVTQTRAVSDTNLQIEGDVARTWMRHAQCFAGPPETAAPNRHAPSRRRLTDAFNRRLPMTTHDKAILTCALNGVLTDPGMHAIPSRRPNARPRPRSL